MKWNVVKIEMECKLAFCSSYKHLKSPHLVHTLSLEISMNYRGHMRS